MPGFTTIKIHVMVGINAAISSAETELKNCDYFIKQRRDDFTKETIEYYTKEKQEALDAITYLKKLLKEEMEK